MQDREILLPALNLELQQFLEHNMKTPTTIIDFKHKTRSFDDKDNVPFLSCGTLTDKCVEKLCELCWDKNSFSLGKIMVPEQKICQSIP